MDIDRKKEADTYILIEKRNMKVSVASFSPPIEDMNSDS